MGLLSSPDQLLVPLGAGIAKGAHAIGIPVSDETMAQANASPSFTDNFDNVFRPMLTQGIIPDYLQNRSNDQIREDTRGMTDPQLRQYAADRAVFLDNGTGRGPTANQVYRQIIKIRSGTSQDIPIYRNVVNEAVNYPGNFSLNALLALEGLRGALESGANIARSEPTPPVKSIRRQSVVLDVDHQPGPPPGTGGAKPPQPKESNVDNPHEAPAKAGASSVLKAVDPLPIIEQSLVRKFGQQGQRFLFLLPEEARARIVEKIVKGEAFGSDEVYVDKAYTTMSPGIRRNSAGNYIRLDKALDDARVAYMNGMRDEPHPWGFVGTNNGLPFARQALGDFGEELAVEHLTKLGYTDLSTIKNASGHGIDIIAKNGAGERVHFEVKASPTERAGGLAEGQRQKSQFLRTRLDAAINKRGKWKNTPQSITDHAKHVWSTTADLKKIPGYKIEVTRAPEGAPHPYVVKLVPWSD